MYLIWKQDNQVVKEIGTDEFILTLVAGTALHKINPNHPVFVKYETEWVLEALEKKVNPVINDFLKLDKKPMIESLNNVWHMFHGEWKKDDSKEHRRAKRNFLEESIWQTADIGEAPEANLDPDLDHDKAVESWKEGEWVELKVQANRVLTELFDGLTFYEGTPTLVSTSKLCELDSIEEDTRQKELKELGVLDDTDYISGLVGQL